ncbi:MAG: MBL fold metallo-hydrolase, partial [Planctomycetota bacterium]|nr:MBL fold metallo-hydrolase [Planctomycetota bacterium]
MLTLEPLFPPLGLWRVQGETNGYLLVRGGRSLLIDCPGPGLARLCQERGLPVPDTILHTQVQEEHCREWEDLAAAEVYVPEAAVEVARRSSQFWAACRTFWPPSREWESERGREKYGFGGCTTERPPAQPLRVCGALRPGEAFRWQSIALEVLALPGSGRYAQGFFWRETGCLFCGDLLRAGGYLVNFYDLERCYGKPFGYTELISSLQAVKALAPRWLLPSTGPVSENTVEDCERLLARVQWVFAPPQRRSGERRYRNFASRRKIGRYVEVAEGVYQSDNAGNVILFVAPDGNGLMVDPDPCIWLPWEESQRAFQADLDLLEKETGLKKVDLAFATHYHGDHCECAPLLKERYGTAFAATPDVAMLLARPEDFPYPALLPWYAFPFARLEADFVLPYDRPLAWSGATFTPIHLPGHCWAHAGLVCVWRGQRILCSGDVFQYGDGPISVPLPICYSDSAWPERGVAVALRRMREARSDLILGGHSHACAGDVDAILADFLACA